MISVGQQLTGDSELSKLKDEISSKSNIKPERLLLKLGFPPKPIIENSASKLLLSQVGIKDGEQIVVEEIPAAAESVLKVTSPVIAPPPTSTTSSRSTNVAVSSLKNSKEQVQIVDLGFLVLREQKDDNSCLFNTIGCDHQLLYFGMLSSCLSPLPS